MAFSNFLTSRQGYGGGGFSNYLRRQQERPNWLSPTRRTFTSDGPGEAEPYGGTALQDFDKNPEQAFSIFRQNQYQNSPWMANALNSPGRYNEVYAKYRAENLNTAVGGQVGTQNFANWLDNNFDAARYLRRLSPQDQGLRPNAFLRGFKTVGG